MPRKKPQKGQRLFPFMEKQGEQKQPQRPLKRKGLSRAERREIKERALALTRQAYAIIKSPRASKIFEGTNPAHIESYRREFGMDIGALRKGRVSAEGAKRISRKVIGFFKRFGIRYREQ